MGSEPSKVFSCMPDYWIASPIITKKTCNVLEQSLHNIVTGHNSKKMCYFIKFYDVFYSSLDLIQSKETSISALFEHDMDRKSLFLVRLLKTCELVAQDFVSKKKRQDTKRHVVLLFEDSKGASPLTFGEIGKALFDGVKTCDTEYSEAVHTAWLHTYSLLLRRLVPLLAPVVKRQNSFSSFLADSRAEDSLQSKRASFSTTSVGSISTNSPRTLSTPEFDHILTGRRRVKPIPNRCFTVPSRHSVPSTTHDEDYQHLIQQRKFLGTVIDQDHSSSNPCSNNSSPVLKKRNRSSLKTKFNSLTLRRKKKGDKPHVRFIMDRIESDGKGKESDLKTSSNSESYSRTNSSPQILNRQYSRSQTDVLKHQERNSPQTTLKKKSRHRKADSWSQLKLFTFSGRRSPRRISPSNSSAISEPPGDIDPELLQIFPDKSPNDAMRQLEKLQHLTNMQTRGEKIRARGRPRSYSAETYNSDYH